MAETPSLDSPPVQVRRSRWKMGVVALAALVLLVIFGFGIADGGQGFMPRNGLFVLALLVVAGLGVNAIIEVIKPGLLIIEPAGLEERLFFRKRRWAWADIEGFDVQRTKHAHYVRLTFTREHQARLPMWRRLFRTANLSSMWELEPAVLVGLLGRARETWRGVPPKAAYPFGKPIVE